MFKIPLPGAAAASPGPGAVVAPGAPPTGAIAPRAPAGVHPLASVMPDGLPKLPDAPAANCPWVGFFSRRSARAAAIAAQIPGIAEGGMFYADGDKYHRLPEDTEFIIINAVGGWCLFNANGEVVKRWSEYTNEVRSLEGAQQKPVEVVDALVVVFGPAGVFAATMSFRSARCRAVRAHLDAAQETETPAWLARHPVAQAVPPAFRLVSTFINSMRTSRSGLAYGVSSAVPKPVTDSHIAKIAEWWAKPESQSEFEAALRAFEVRTKQ